MKNFVIILVAVLTIALPFIFRKEKPMGEWHEGDPVLVVISPHIAVIRDEFAIGFSNWHYEKYGKPVKIDWRSIGGTTEIMRYLNGEYVAAYRGYCKRNGIDFDDSIDITSRRRPTDENAAKIWDDFRNHDNPEDYNVMVDVFFGGGTYDHSSAARSGLTVVPWENPPKGLLEDDDGVSMFPEGLGGEVWRSNVFYSAVLSGFGICWNPDRLQDLGITETPKQWRDLTNPALIGKIGVTDPTKSGSIAKAFEMIIYSECMNYMKSKGWTKEDFDKFEGLIAEANLPLGVMPDGVPQQYQKDLEDAWLYGLDLIRRIGANVRYFTDSAGKVPIDVSSGDAVVGISIDFYSRVQQEVTRDRVTGKNRLEYITPEGGSSISGDPISLLRGAPNKELALRFMEYVLGPDGQKLWNYKPGTPGGPVYSALRRMPVRRDFYADNDNANVQVRAEEHAKYTSDNLLDPKVDVYKLASSFTYYPRWTSSHFSFFRQLIRAMCLDSGHELRSAWATIVASGGPEKCPKAMGLLMKMPSEPINISWKDSLNMRNIDNMECMRQWTIFFRNTYKEAAQQAKAEASK